MPGSLTIRQAHLVLPDRVAKGDLVIEDGVISHIGPRVSRTSGEEIDGTGLTVLPGVIDTAVHFCDPGWPEREDLASGSGAAAAGGVTSYLDLPDTRPPCTSVDALHHKLALAAERSAVHYGFFIGATEDNLSELLAAERACGITVNLGVDGGCDRDMLEQVFSEANKIISVHAEDAARLRERTLLYADSHDVADHARIHDVDSALLATKTVTDLAMRYGRRLHLRHLSSADEVAHIGSLPHRETLSASVCLPHLFLSAETAYDELASYAQCDPPIRTRRHTSALWRALQEGIAGTVSSEHSPHTKQRKNAVYPTSPSGIPGVEWTLPLFLDRVNSGELTLNQVVTWLSEGPASCFRIPRKGRLEVGYDGDVVLVDMAAHRTIESSTVWSRCRWSPYAGREVRGWPILTVVLGCPVFREGDLIEGVRGRELTFRR